MVGLSSDVSEEYGQNDYGTALFQRAAKTMRVKLTSISLETVTSHAERIRDDKVDRMILLINTQQSKAYSSKLT